MAQLAYSLSADGPMLDVFIGLPGASLALLQAAGQPFPAPTRARALLDTGTTVTALAPWIIREQNLPPKGRRGTHTAAGSVQVNLFDGSLGIDGPSVPGGPMFLRPTLLVTELVHSPPDVDVLVGMDILFDFLTVLDGPRRQFSLSF